MQERFYEITESLTETWKKIDTLFSIDPTRVIEVDGVEMFEEVDESNPRRYCNCTTYTLGHPGENFVINTIISPEREVDFVEGSVAVYFDKSDNITHAGEVAADGDIISKWGASGHVYKHKPALVPEDYGNKVRCFVRPEKS